VQPARLRRNHTDLSAAFEEIGGKMDQVQFREFIASLQGGEVGVERDEA
jgi:hypothetical protein